MKARLFLSARHRGLLYQIFRTWAPRCLALWCLALCCLAALTPPASAEPRLGVGSGDWLLLQDLPLILDDEEVRDQLTSGLTTSFHLTLEHRGSSSQGGARIEIRYLLWEETFQAKTFALDGSTTQSLPKTVPELHSWWRQLRLPVLHRPTARSRETPVRINLEVIPFSAREEEDTRRWLSETLNRSNDNPGAVEGPGSEGTSLSQVFNVLIATSIRRKVVRAYRWSLPLPKEAPP